MSDNSAIEWTDATWNPATGCDEVSPGCARCYAKTFAERWRGVPGHPYEHGFDLQLRPERLQQPSLWTRPRLVFVNSMSDLFHERIPDDYIREIFAAMHAAPWHTYQVLTKRHERLASLGPTLDWGDYIWAGVSIENRRWVRRADALRAVPAPVRFISAEPLVGPLDGLELNGIDWVICGGESGHRARPMHADWARSLRDQCVDDGVAFFFKQWGGRTAKSGGRELDGEVHDEMPPLRAPKDVFASA